MKSILKNLRRKGDADAPASNSDQKPKKKGFAALSPEKRRELGRRGALAQPIEAKRKGALMQPREAKVRGGKNSARARYA